MRHMIIFLLLIFSLFPYLANASITVPWSSSMTGCPEWEWAAGNNDPGCDGLYRYGGNTTSAGEGEQITSSANNPNGPDGANSMGQRHWLRTAANVNDDDNSGGLKAIFDNPQSHVWIRYYQRWPSGVPTDWHNYKSTLIFRDGSTSGFIRQVLAYNGLPNIGLVSVGDNPQSNNVYWGYNVYPGGQSDGSFYAYEIELDCASDTVRQWLEGVLVHEDTSAGLSCSTIYGIAIGSNIKWAYVSPPGVSYPIDYDDMVITNSPNQVDSFGNPFIGTLSGTPAPDTTDPVVNVTAPANGSTISSSLSFTANATDNVGVVGVQFQIDGSNYGAEDTTSPYSISLDTTTLTDASHTFTAIARDAAGNSTTSSTITATVDNTGGSGQEGELLLEENFEDSSLASRGWYDNTANQVIDNTEYQTTEGSSTASAKYHFAVGAVTPDPGGAVRHKFTPTEELYITFYVKYSTGYIGSGNSTHPHEFFVLSEADNDYNSPNYSFMQMKIEQNALYPRVIMRDDKRVNTSFGTPPIDLTGTTELRAVNGCNGEPETGPSNYDCYTSGGNWYNHKDFLHTSPVITTNTWHKVAIHAKLNTTGAGTTNADGILKYWLNGNLIMNHTDVIYRTSAYTGIGFDQFAIAPYIGTGSPVDQTMWFDDLKIYNSYTEEEVPAPTNFVISAGATTSGMSN